MKVLILLSTYNGEKFLQEQLDSLYRQTIPVDILVRDDGSTDNTKTILQQNADLGKLMWYTGENLKPEKSFWDLINKAPQADYYAFCDQDDVWFDDKVERAIKYLKDIPNQERPLLYCSNVDITDAELNSTGLLCTGETYYTDFAHALIYSLAPGCTMVFNSLARNEMIKYNMKNEFVIMHDWLAHKIVAMLGTVVFDKEPTMFYRQHGNNVIGAQKTKGIKALFKRIKRVLGSHANIRSNNAKSLLNVYGEQIDEERRHILDIVANYRNNRKLKREFLKDCRYRIKGKSFLSITIKINKV